MKTLVCLSCLLAPLVSHSATFDFTGVTSNGLGEFAGINEAVYGTLTFDIERADPSRSSGMFGTASQWSALNAGGVYGGAPEAVPLMFTETVFSQATGQALYATAAIAGASGDASFIGAGNGYFYGASENVIRGEVWTNSDFMLQAAPGNLVFDSNGLPKTFEVGSPNSPQTLGGSAVSYVSITSGSVNSGFEVHFNSLVAAAGAAWSEGSKVGGANGGQFMAPEIDPSSGVAALTMLVGGLLVLRTREGGRTV